jgi:hypothetical protein
MVGVFLVVAALAVLGARDAARAAGPAVGST